MIDGVDYHFISKKFKELIAQNNFMNTQIFLGTIMVP